MRAEIMAAIPEAELAACLAVLERILVGLAPPPDPGPKEDPDGHRPA
ncbi:hypothetical protein ACFQU2_20885 [Siccirubricoccus deserti]